LENDLASRVGMMYPSVGAASSKSSLALESLFIDCVPMMFFR
jgi:hypothetical protein